MSLLGTPASQLLVWEMSAHGLRDETIVSGMSSTCGLADLPNDALCLIVQNLPDPEEVVFLGLTCKRLWALLCKVRVPAAAVAAAALSLVRPPSRRCLSLSLLTQDEVWEGFMHSWLRRESQAEAFYSMPDMSPREVATALGLSTLRGACVAVRLLKTWPEGVWSCADEPYSPRGMVLRGVRMANEFHLGFVFARPAHPQPWPGATAAIRVRAPPAPPACLSAF